MPVEPQRTHTIEACKYLITIVIYWDKMHQWFFGVLWNKIRNEIETSKKAKKDSQVVEIHVNVWKSTFDTFLTVVFQTSGAMPPTKTNDVLRVAPLEKVHTCLHRFELRKYKQFLFSILSSEIHITFSTHVRSFK